MREKKITEGVRGSKISGEACENMAARLTKANRRQVKKTSSCIAVYIYTQNYHLYKTQFFNISTKRELNFVTQVNRNLILLLRIFFPPSIKLRPFLHHLHISQPSAPASPSKHLFSLFYVFYFFMQTSLVL